MKLIIVARMEAQKLGYISLQAGDKNIELKLVLN
jgi:hypothetical protein